jgi:hypothetical protein
LHKRQGISLSNEFSFSKDIILCEVNYEVQYDDIFITATNIIFDANPFHGSELIQTARMERHAKMLSAQS